MSLHFLRHATLLNILVRSLASSLLPVKTLLDLNRSVPLLVSQPVSPPSRSSVCLSVCLSVCQSVSPSVSQLSERVTPCPTHSFELLGVCLMNFIYIALRDTLVVT